MKQRRKNLLLLPAVWFLRTFYYFDPTKLSINQKATPSLLKFIEFFYAISNLIVITSGKPHIILIVADDLGWNDVGFHGMRDIPTPNIDHLASQGVILHNYYTCPMCTPSRASLFSGKYPHNTGLQNYVVPESGDWGLPLSVTTLPQRLEQMGYQNHLVGKWHLGFYKKEFTPTRRGFKSHFGFWTGAIDFLEHYSESGSLASDYKNLPENLTLSNDKITLIGHDFRNNLKTLHAEGQYLTDMLTERAVQVIKNHDTTEPLFLCLTHHAVHRGNPLKPMYSIDKYTADFSYIKDDKRRNFAGALKALDLSIKEVTDTLSERNMLNNSVIIFTTDNGADVSFMSSNGGSNWPLRGEKFTTWEGGVRGVAFVWSSTHLDRKGLWNGMMHVVDWYPTILAIAGFKSSSVLDQLDGIDMWHSISTNTSSERTEMILSLDPIWNVSAIRYGDYKMVSRSFPYQDLNKWTGYSGRDVKIEFIDDNPVESLTIDIDCGPRPNHDVIQSCDARKEPCLFNIAKDPCEYTNLAMDKPEILDILRERLRLRWNNAVQPLTGKRDYLSNPQLYNREWVSWKDDVIEY